MPRTITKIVQDLNGLKKLVLAIYQHNGVEPEHDNRSIQRKVLFPGDMGHWENIQTTIEAHINNAAYWDALTITYHAIDYLLMKTHLMLSDGQHAMSKEAYLMDALTKVPRLGLFAMPGLVFTSRNAGIAKMLERIEYLNEKLDTLIDNLDLSFFFKSQLALNRLTS